MPPSQETSVVFFLFSFVWLVALVGCLLPMFVGWLFFLVCLVFAVDVLLDDVGCMDVYVECLLFCGLICFCLVCASDFV